MFEEVINQELSLFILSIFLGMFIVVIILWLFFRSREWGD